jgi:hypothetical protein
MIIYINTKNGNHKKVNYASYLHLAVYTCIISMQQFYGKPGVKEECQAPKHVGGGEEEEEGTITADHFEGHKKVRG